MVLQSASSASPLKSCDFSRKSLVLPSISQSHRKRRERIVLIQNARWVLLQAQACINGGNAQHHHLGAATRRGANNIVLKRFSDGRDLDYASLSRFDGSSNYYNSTFGQDPIVDKLRSQLGVIHAIPSPTQINSSIFGLFAFFFFVGVGFDKLWTSRKRNTGSKPENRPQMPTTLSMLLEKDLQRKESVEWVNMVLGKLWKVYRSGLENWIIGLLQPVIDNLMKPDYVRRVEIKQFSLGDEPLSVRSVERRTSRRDNDLQFYVIHGVEDIFNGSILSPKSQVGILEHNAYFDSNVNRIIIFRSFAAEFVRVFLESLPVFLPILRSIIWECLQNYYLEAGPLVWQEYLIGLRYTGGARMLLSVSLKFGIIPIVVPIRVRDFDIDGELWVKLRLIPTEPWVGAVSWAFASLPRIKFELSPFRLFNLMAIPVLSMFLTKLLTVDLPQLFVRPKKIVLDFEKGKAVGPVPNDSKSGEIQERINNFAGELSVTLLDARKLSYVFYGKTDPYVILSLGDQVIRSKRNSLTTVIGPPGEPIWNQDFHMLVTNPRKEKLCIEVKDMLGITDLTVGTGEVDLATLKDTVPADRIVVLRGWGLFGKGSAGEILLRLTYKAYVEDDEDERLEKVFIDTGESNYEFSDSDESYAATSEPCKESFMDVLSALMLSEEFQGIMTSESVNTKSSDAGTGSDTPDMNGRSVGSIPLSSGSNTDSSRGSTLFWLALITSISVLIAINMGNSSLFNP